MQALGRVARLALLGLFVVLATPPGFLAAQEVTDLDDAHAIAIWRTRLDEGRVALAEARHRFEAAHDAYADWRQRKVPRGVRKEKLVREVTESETALAKARVAWQELQERARRAGVPPGVLRDYE